MAARLFKPEFPLPESRSLPDPTPDMLWMLAPTLPL